MKRLFILVAAGAAMVALPAVSGASDAERTATARGGNDLKIRFDLVSVGNDPKRIEDFKFKNFTVSCAVGGPVDVDGELAKMRINDAGKFEGNAKNGNAKVHVEGELKRGGRKVVGFLKSSGDFGGAQNCKTKVEWKAS